MRTTGSSDLRAHVSFGVGAGGRCLIKHTLKVGAGRLVQRAARNGAAQLDRVLHDRASIVRRRTRGKSRNIYGEAAE